MKRILSIIPLLLVIFTGFSSDGNDVYNAYSKTDENNLKLYWSVDNPDEIGGVIVRYRTALDDKHKRNNDAWMYSDLLSPEAHSTVLSNLKQAEKYVWQVGVIKNGASNAVEASKQAVWSKKNKATTGRSFGLMQLLIIIGSLGLFIYGMKVMSEGLQQNAGGKLRKMLGSITSNRVSGVLTGFGITSIVQSSSVTTVMTVSFVNAGLLTLTQSAGVMLGANIGTTITGWLVAIFGFKVSISAYAVALVALGAPLLFFRNTRFKSVANIVIGFAILFLGLGMLKDAVPKLDETSALVQFFIEYKDVWYGPVMFVFLGALITVIIQSSSAAMTLTMTLVAAGMIPFEVAAAMVLGENIGTTITAELASTIGNVYAKRSARIHSLFNLIGVTWMLLIFPWFIDWIGGLVGIDTESSKVLSSAEKEHLNTGLALFHTTFNLANVLLMIWFIPMLVRFAEKSVPSKGGEDEQFHLDYISGGILATPELSIQEAKKEVAKFGKIASRMNGFLDQLLWSSKSKEKDALHSRIKRYEEITDRVEIEVANYLSRIAQGEMSEESSQRIRGMLAITNDLERIGDIYYQMSKTLERKDEERMWISPKQRENLKKFGQLIDKAFGVMISNLEADPKNVDLDMAVEIEKEVNNYRNELRREQFSNMDLEDYNSKSGIIYNDLFSSFEKIGDHIINVSEALAGKL